MLDDNLSMSSQPVNKNIFVSSIQNNDSLKLDGTTSVRKSKP